jgi:hypothetical protein
LQIVRTKISKGFLVHDMIRFGPINIRKCTNKYLPPKLNYFTSWIIFFKKSIDLHKL